MDREEAKELARGITAICMPTAFAHTGPGSFNPEETRQYSQQMLNKLYSIFLRMDDKDFIDRLKQAGLLAQDIWQEPEEVKGLLQGDLSDMLVQFDNFERPIK